MKRIFFSVIILFSYTIFAGEFTDFSRIQFQTASTWVPANKTCTSEGFLYYKKKEATSAVSALQKALASYLEKKPYMTINALSKKCSVGEPTLRRIFKE